MAAAAVPPSLQLYFEKAIQAYTQGCYEYAIDLLAHVVRQNPDATEPRRYLRLATQKLQAQHPPSLASQLAMLLLGLPFQLLAAVAILQGRHRHAVQHYERLLCLQPRSKGLLLRLASTLGGGGMDDAAAATYEELLGLDPDHLGALRRLARLSMKRGQDDQARRCFERILAIAPSDVEAQQGLRNLDALGTIKRGFTA